MRIELPTARLVKAPVDRRAATKADLLKVRGEAGVGHDNFVTRVDEHVKQCVQPLHVTGSDHDIPIGVNSHAGGGKVRQRGRFAEFR